MAFESTKQTSANELRRLAIELGALAERGVFKDRTRNGIVEIATRLRKTADAMEN